MCIRDRRYYDEIGLLKTARVASNGYRIYGQAQVDLLQQILFYRALEMCIRDSRPTVGGIRPLSRASTEATASAAPAAPSMWPVTDLVELIIIFRASASPKAFFTAKVSALSCRGVPVPWALR